MEYQQAESKKLARKKEELASKGGKVEGLAEGGGMAAEGASLSVVTAPGETNNNKESPESPPCSTMENFGADLSLDERDIKLLNGSSPPIPHEFEMPPYLDEHSQLSGMELNISGGREAVASGHHDDDLDDAEATDQMNQLQGSVDEVQTKDQAVTTHLPEFFLPPNFSYGIQRPVTEGQEDLRLLQEDLRTTIALSNEMEFKVEVDAQTESNHDTALTIACAGGYDDVVHMLLEKNASIEHRDKKGFTPLILAATAGHYKTVKILLNKKAEIEAQSERTKDTPLSLACSGGRYEVVELLLKHGANKEHRNVSDYTPLSLAASGGYVNIIKLLLKSGAEINSRTGSKLGISPLMLAAMNGHTPAVKLLLDNGSDINAQIETNRNTALTLAAFRVEPKWRPPGCGAALGQRRSDIDSQDNRKMSCLLAAFRKGHVKVVRWMVKHVNQFPSDAECLRFISTISDKELQKKCNTSFEIIVVAKDRQAAEANKNANSLLEELETEKNREETRKAAQAKRREKKRKKRKEKQQKVTSNSTSPDEPIKDEEEEEEEEDSPPSSTAESLEERVPLEPPSATTTTTIGVVRTTNSIRTFISKKLKEGTSSTVSTTTSTTTTTSIIPIPTPSTTPLIIEEVSPTTYENTRSGKEKGADDEKRNEKRQKIRDRKEQKKKTQAVKVEGGRVTDENRGKARKKKLHSL
ncbi:putative ankyrin repeat and KH domain-containing protein 1 [Apostichopus japonicus]|uniref:Putative ankyrin repeat and KH domain-containing protein 1 n=1 Tax=Stichopus japonicus TaxID=307972 RepID=A0A2G8JFV5_STIJA|nr:putative ankyrin repeat and KH domain-containing protein 1 [Apostichopus japonicus]